MKKKLLTISVPMSQKKKFEEAKEDFQRMWEEIKPFIKKRNVERHSTIGEWRTTT